MKDSIIRSGMKRDEYEAILLAEIERLRAALSPFARHAHCTNEIQPSSLALWCAQALNALSDVDQQSTTEPK